MFGAGWLDIRDAHGNRGLQLCSVEIDRQARHANARQFDQDQAILALPATNDHRKLFTTQSRYAVKFTKHILDGSGSPLDDDVTRSVTMRIVDPLESIKVKDSQRRVALDLIKALVESSSVSQAGQSIRLAQTFEFSMRGVQLADCVSED